MKTRKNVKIVVILLVLYLLPISGMAYYEKVHALVAKLAIMLLEAEDQRRQPSLYEEIYYKKHFTAIGKSAWQEDFGVVRGNDRSFRHYYDPDARGVRKGVPYYPYYALWKLEGAAVKPPKHGAYEGALEWARRGTDMTEKWGVHNPLNWEGAIRAYDYTPGSRMEAYRRLGHVVHLLVDMAEPDHAGNVPHGGSGFMLPESIDDICGPKVVDILKSVDMTPALKMQLIHGIVMADIKLKNLLTKGNLDIRTIGFEGLIEDTVAPSMVQEFFAGGYTKNNKSSRGFIKNPPPIKGKTVRRMKDLDDYFNSLAYQSKKEVTEKNEFSLALGVAELFQYLKLSNNQRMKEYIRDPFNARMKYWGGKAIEKLGTKGQLFIVPIIDRKNQGDMMKFYELARGLLATGVELSAGLMEHFHDIVNPPPYVRSVKVEQGGKNIYYAYWKDSIVPQSGSTKSSMPNMNYDTVPNRVWIKDETGGELEPGKKGVITIEFGPTCGEFKEPINPNISVAIGEISAKGKLQKGNKSTTWIGGFEIPASLVPAEGEKIPIVISAKDNHIHYDPKTRSFVKGFVLDSDPKTPAKVWCGRNNSYNWNGYEAGEDKYHSVMLKGIELDLEESVEEEEKERIEDSKKDEATEEVKSIFYLEPSIWKDRMDSDYFIVNYYPRTRSSDILLYIFYEKVVYNDPKNPKLSYTYEKKADANYVWRGVGVHPHDPDENWTYRGKDPEKWWAQGYDSNDYISPSPRVTNSCTFTMHVKARDGRGRVYEAKATFIPSEWKAIEKRSEWDMNYPCVRVGGERK